MFYLMCCGCLKLMDETGNASIPFALGGVLSDASLEAIRTAPCFPGKSEADAAAAKSGWRVIDGNHRCPNCFDVSTPRVGAYISADLLHRQIES